MAIDIRMNYIQHDSLGKPFGIEGVLRSMQKYRMEKAMLVPSLAVDSDFRSGNSEMLEAMNSDDRLYGYLVVNPNYVEESIQLMRSHMNLPKFKAMAIFSGASKPHPNADDCRDLLNAYRRFTKPVLLNAPNLEAVSDVVEIAKEFPTIKFIIGGMGGPDWKGAIQASKVLNTLLETSGSFDAEKVGEAVEQFGAHRVLFGSDTPFSDPASMLAMVHSSGLPKVDLLKILGDNAKTLFKLDSDDSREEAEE